MAVRDMSDRASLRVDDSSKSRSISVIIPAFDAASTLMDCLRSATEQTLVPLEVIVVDDGSNDATLEVARNFPGPVRCLRQDHSGVAVARNLGIEAARGDLIAFLDADDLWRRDHLANAARALEAEPNLVWVSCAYEKVGASGRRIHASVSGAERQPFFVASYFELLETWISYTPTMVLRRSLLEEVGGFDAEMPTGEDLHLWFRIAVRYPEIGYSSEPTVVIRDTEGSLGKQGLFTLEHAARFVEKLRNEASAYGRADDPAVRKSLMLWSMPVLREGLRRRDRAVFSWMREEFPAEIPLKWRFLTRLCEGAPEPLWRRAMLAWDALREVRTGAARARSAS